MVKRRGRDICERILWNGGRNAKNIGCDIGFSHLVCGVVALLLAGEEEDFYQVVKLSEPEFIEFRNYRQQRRLAQQAGLLRTGLYRKEFLRAQVGKPTTPTRKLVPMMVTFCKKSNLGANSRTAYPASIKALASELENTLVNVCQIGASEKINGLITR